MIMSLCNICKKKLSRISKINYITEETKHSWESDSTFEILKLKQADVFLSFCYNCYYSTILPKFDTDLIYNDKASKTRKKYFESYNPNKIYGYKDQSLIEKKLFQMSTNELLRIKNITKLLSYSKISDNKNYKILDYGGGSGFVSKTISAIINGISDYNSEYHLYELEEWNGEKIIKKLDQKYDLIILCHVLEHSHDPISIVNKCKNLLSDNGMIYCELPDERLNIIRCFYKKFGLHYHVFHHSRRSLYSIFKKCGFGFIKSKYFLHSSYQGVRMSIISCIVSNNKTILPTSEKIPSRLYENFSIIFRALFYLFKKIILRTDNLLR
jgi:hypothetical protein